VNCGNAFSASLGSKGSRRHPARSVRTSVRSKGAPRYRTWPGQRSSARSAARYAHERIPLHRREFYGSGERRVNDAHVNGHVWPLPDTTVWSARVEEASAPDIPCPTGQGTGAGQP
jgi:hypothetical protein